MTTTQILSQSAPFTDYGAALARIEAMRSTEKGAPGFNPEMQSILLSHGQKTARAVLWFHGYTSAPPQFRPLAELCFDRGYNAFIPCVPHHGFRDRFSPEMSRVRTAELVQFAEDTVDLMHGLGNEIIVGGLSMGGAMASWVAQQRADVSTVLIIAAFLGARIVPARLTRLVSTTLGFLPDQRQWWDEQKKEASPGPDFEYLKRSTHSLSQIIALGFRTFDLARHRPPAAGKIWMVINDHDDSVNNEINQQLVDTWRRSAARNVETFHFPDALGLPHNCIGVGIPGGNTPLVYPELMRMIG